MCSLVNEYESLSELQFLAHKIREFATVIEKTVLLYAAERTGVKCGIHTSNNQLTCIAAFMTDFVDYISYVA